MTSGKSSAVVGIALMRETVQITKAASLDKECRMLISLAMGDICANSRWNWVLVIQRVMVLIPHIFTDPTGRRIYKTFPKFPLSLSIIALSIIDLLPDNGCPLMSVL